MQWEAGPEWDHIDQLTLEEVEKSWAHSRCRKVEFDISGCLHLVSVWVWRVSLAFSVVPQLTRLMFGLVYEIQYPVQGSTLDPTIKLLFAAVRGIIQRRETFVLNLLVHNEQVSRLVEFEDIAKNKCAVTRTERGHERGRGPVTVLELRPHCEYP